MRCSGCGKDVPFGGSVCPYCQRDKSQDQNYTIVAFIFGTVGGAIGYFAFDFWGAICGFFIGCIAAAALTLSGKTDPPKVQVADSKPVPADSPISDKLAQLKRLHEDGLLTDEEFSAKKSDILAKF
jgi:hypothetical protein